MSVRLGPSRPTGRNDLALGLEPANTGDPLRDKAQLSLHVAKAAEVDSTVRSPGPKSAKSAKRFAGLADLAGLASRAQLSLSLIHI
eukprot:5421417-Alexandrium_andersonii.AAC.1